MLTAHGVTPAGLQRPDGMEGIFAHDLCNTCSKFISSLSTEREPEVCINRGTPPTLWGDDWTEFEGDSRELQLSIEKSHLTVV